MDRMGPFLLSIALTAVVVVLLLFGNLQLRLMGLLAIALVALRFGRGPATRAWSRRPGAVRQPSDADAARQAQVPGNEVPAAVTAD